jgi:hypothetical protein
MPMIQDMKRAIGVMAVLLIVTIVAVAVEDDPVLTGSGCPVGTDRWATVGVDLAGDEAGFATEADAIRAWLREVNLDASDASIVRAIDRSDREGGGSIMVETTEGLPAVVSVEIVSGGWFVTDADWCRVRASTDHVEG